MLVLARLKTFTVCERRMGIGTLFQAVAARNENKFAETQFFALRCARCTPTPLVEESATCKPTSDA